jgi:hypothetical protein
MHNPFEEECDCEKPRRCPKCGRIKRNYPFRIDHIGKPNTVWVTKKKAHTTFGPEQRITTNCQCGK